MRFISILVTLFVASSIAFVVFAMPKAVPDATKDNNTYFTNVVAARDSALLDTFMASLDPTIMKEYVAIHDAGKPSDLDYLATCGDFDSYARYMRVSKFEAVKKFEYVLLHSSSKLEFEDRLAR